MSRHHLAMGRQHIAIVGWDRPVGSFFIQIDDATTDDQPVIVLDDIPSVIALALTLDAVCARLRLPCVLPDDLIRTLLMEQVGVITSNVVRHWTTSDPNAN